MAAEDRQKIPVPRHTYLWSLNETSGEILTHIGPTEFTPSANDRIVRANGRGAFEQAPMEARPFIIARDGEYILLDNPMLEDRANHNGTFVPGGNKEKPLALGTTRVIPGPAAFPLWPGQSAEVRPAHKLGANHYLLVEVVGPVDEDAPYAQLTIDSAGLGGAVIEGADESAGALDTDRRPVKLAVGQRIVIQGRHTQFFIPPTGIQVVPAMDESEGAPEEDGIAHLTESVVEELNGLLAKVEEGLAARQFSVLKNEIRHRGDLEGAQKAVMLTALDDAFTRRRESRASRPGERADRRAGRPTDPYARRAVVLGPKNFCYLFDADGNPRIVRGPARVFPGPHDTFLQRGSRRRVYDAYELGEHQALWLRIISRISREELAAKLSAKVAGGNVLDKATYEPGDELLVRGEPSVFFPFIEAEVLHPETREPHVGNDHDQVIVDAVGIDQKSGIYVRDLHNGMVKMVRGETSYLVDPRREVHVRRRIPAEDWNLWIGHAEPHKRTGHDVDTPWAVSVIVPNNEAIHITSRHGRRVVTGPCTELLEYEERLTALALSDGPTKDGSHVMRSCFLRVRGGRTTDTFEVESSDFVEFKVKLQIAYELVGDSDRWFDVEDPIKLLADTLRARLREAARTRAATALLTEFPELVRETLLQGGQPLRFAANGLAVTDLDVLTVAVTDTELARLFDDTQRELVKLQLGDHQAARRLESTQHRDRIDAEEHTLQRSANRRMAETSRMEAEDGHGLESRKLELEADRADLSLLRDQVRAQARAERELAREKAIGEARAAAVVRDADAHARADHLRHDEHNTYATVQAELERATARALAEADAVRLAAIQRELVAALHGAADSEVMKAAANNMNLVSLLGGKTPAELFEQLLRGTPLVRSTISMQRRTDGAPEPSE